MIRIYAVQLAVSLSSLASLCLPAAAGAAAYTADAAQSRLEFVGVQAGAEFKGAFHNSPPPSTSRPTRWRVRTSTW